MSIQNPKHAVFACFAEVGKALGHSHRLEILELLAQGERSVESLAGRAGLSIANASQHLRLMRRAGLLASRRDGKHIIYRLSDSSVLDLTTALHRVAERNLSEVREVVGVVLTHAHDDHIGDAAQIAKKTGAQIISSFEICMHLNAQGAEKHQPGQHWRHDRLRLFQREFHSGAAFILDNNQRPISLSWQSQRHCHQA
jgi:DNA-binding transcriptional ArsR family regulator